MANEFAALIKDQSFMRVVESFQQTIKASFYDDRSRVTQAERRRRFEICARILRSLRGEYQWGLQRILDHMPIFLRNELDGIPWEPKRRRMWAPEAIERLAIRRRTEMNGGR